MTVPLSTSTLAEHAYQVVEEMIVTLKLRPGEVFSEAELGASAYALQMSKTLS